MQIEVDPDVTLVLEFMQRTMQGEKLVPVALAVAQLAPILWREKFSHSDLFSPLELSGAYAPGIPIRTQVQRGGVEKQPQ